MKTVILSSVIILFWLFVVFGCKKHNDLANEIVVDSLFYKNTEASVIYSSDSTQPLRILSAFNQADSITLKKISKNVKVVNDTTKYLINRMIRTIFSYQSNIDGIAAPEIGLNRRIIIVKRKDKPGTPFEVFINPKITQHSNASTIYNENCITMQGVYPTSISRYNLITVEYYSLNGIFQTETIELETAEIVQHEIAHLTGGVLQISYDPLAFTGSEIDSIMFADSLTPMRIYLITNYNDSLVLRKQSIDVRPDSSNEILVTMIRRMRKTLLSTSGGVGIAAPQIGINRNVILVKRLDKIGKPIEAYLNPRIIMTSDKIINFGGDGCLSIPGVNKTTQRFAAVGIEYDLLDGTHKTEVVEGYSATSFTAVIFQHEIDHLNGILFIDRAIN